MPMTKTVAGNSEHIMANTRELGNHEPDLYETQLESFRNLLKTKPEEALELYGFTFYFSLSQTERLRINKLLGLEPSSAIEFYNHACTAIEDSNWQEASELLSRALELDPKFADAAYNLALCYERLGQKTEAKKAWDTFLALCNDATLKEQILAHVAELTSK